MTATEVNKIDEMIAVLQAAKAGKQIEARYRPGDNEFVTCKEPMWDFYAYDYRVKPEPREWLISLDALKQCYADTMNPLQQHYIKVREVL